MQTETMRRSIQRKFCLSHFAPYKKKTHTIFLFAYLPSARVMPESQSTWLATELCNQFVDGAEHFVEVASS